MAKSRVTPYGWQQETDAKSRVTPSGWVQEIQSGGGAVSGTLAATESGSDTLAISGKVLVSGALAVTESGADDATLSGIVLVQGALAATETGADDCTITGEGATPAITGSLAASESGADTASLAGKVYVAGTLSAVEGGLDAFAISGDILVQGALAATESGSDTAAFASVQAVHRILLRTAQVASNKPDDATAFDFTGASVSLLAFSWASRGLNTGDTTSYYADNGEGDWERGVGTWDASSSTLTRTTIRESSNSNLAVDWSGGANAPTVWADGRQPEDDIDLPSTAAVLLGDASTDGSWRVYRAGDDLEFQRRESGAWTMKGRVQA